MKKSPKQSGADRLRMGEGGYQPRPQAGDAPQLPQGDVRPEQADTAVLYCGGMTEQGSRKRKPWKLTPERKGLYLDALRRGLRKGPAAESIGMTRDGIRKAASSDPEFAAAIEAAELDAVEAVEDALYDAALSGNIVAIQVVLYNRAPGRWADRRNLKMTGADGGPIKIVQWREVLLTKEEAGKEEPSSGEGTGSG